MGCQIDNRINNNVILFFFNLALGPNIRPEMNTGFQRKGSAGSFGIRRLFNRDVGFKSVKPNLFKCPDDQINQSPAFAHKHKNSTIRLVRLGNGCVSTHYFHNHLIQACQRLINTGDINMELFCLVLLEKLLPKDGSETSKPLRLNNVLRIF